MRAASGIHPDGTGSSRAARILLWAYLGCTLLSKLFDANLHDTLAYVPFVLACYVLPVWFLTGRRPGPWRRAPWALLAVQLVVSYLPLVVFGSQWVGGVDGLLGALVLLVLRGRARWWLFAGLAIGEIAAWSLAGFPYGPAVSAAVWLLVAYLNLGLGVYGMTTAVALLERLESTSEVLADTAVDRQRLATAHGLQTTIMRRLEEVRAHARAALAAPPGEGAGGELRAMGAAARDAASSARRIASAVPPPALTAHEDDVISPAVAFRVVAAVISVFAVQYLANVIQAAGGDPALIVVAVVIAIGMVLLQLRLSRAAGSGRPTGWPWILAAQTVLCFALYPVIGIVSLAFLGFIAGSVLLLITHPVRWAVFGLALAAFPVLTLLRPADLQPALQLQWSVYAAATLAASSLLVYGLGRFARAAAQLAVARHRLADAAATRERVRIARDTHDALGLALSTIALKSDLAQALLVRDPARAHREIVQAMHLARTVVADAESIVTGTLRLDVSTELSTARDALDAAGVALRIDVDSAAIPATIETELAAVLREAVANVLRHSDARTCGICIAGTGDAFVVTVTNDGLRPLAAARSDGHGLANIRARIAALGGTVDADAHGDRFALVAQLPRVAEPVSVAAS